MKTLKIKGTLITEMLGTNPMDPNIHSAFIASKAPDTMKREEEIESIGALSVEKKEMTVFPRLGNKLDSNPFIWEYQIMGFLKSAARAMNRVSDSEVKKNKAFIKIIEDTVFISPRKIPVLYNGSTEGNVGNLQRSLRAQTMQGDRIALANSETIPEGATFEFEITLLDGKYEKLLFELLDYGKFKGLLQWRNAGYGRFTYEVE